MNQLSVVIPYRDRWDHLKIFLPRILKYFKDRNFFGFSSVEVSIIEQAGNGPFNRGKLLNVGFTLGKETSVCTVFHDVDYVPVRADYSIVEKPARLIWHGLTLREDYENFFGAVSMVPNDLFEQVNGYANCYWGWGFEDTDLRERFRRLGIQVLKRDGVFEGLYHSHNGMTMSGLSDAAKKNKEMFFSRIKSDGPSFFSDGLTSLNFLLKKRTQVTGTGDSRINVVWYLCEI